MIISEKQIMSLMGYCHELQRFSAIIADKEYITGIVNLLNEIYRQQPEELREVKE